jgi:amino acid transporter
MTTTVQEQEGSLPAASIENSGLRPGAIGGLAAGAMAVAFAAPSVSMFFNSPVMAASAGSALPAAFIFSAVAIALVAANLAAFASKLPTSNYAYSFVSHGFGPSTGFVSAWFAVLVYVATPILVPPVFGTTMSALIDRLLGISIPWWILTLLLLVAAAMLVIRGIAQSARVGMIFLCIEMTVLGCFALYMVINGGPHGQQPASLLPTTAPSFGAIGLALVFGTLSFGGFESAATLGGETRDPLRLIPRALMFAVLIAGVFYTFVSYSAVVGWGAKHMGSYATASGTPFTALALRYGGQWLADMLDVVVLSGLLAVTLAGLNAASRVLHALGSEGLLPRALGTVSPKSGVPKVAALATAIVGGGGGLLFGLLWTPQNVWNFTGTIGALGTIFIYMFVSASTIVYFRRSHRAEFSPLRHLIVPLVAIGVLCLPLALKGGLIWPAPAWPFNLTPYIVAAWFLVGVSIVVYFKGRQPAVLTRAAEALTRDG